MRDTDASELCLLACFKIQRWSRAVQDVLLPSVEKGDVILLAATTENPSFRLQAALLSRLRVFVLEKMTLEDTRALLRRARGRVVVSASSSAAAAADDDDDEDALPLGARDEMLDWIAVMADGDARTALNSLELALLMSSQDSPTDMDSLKTLLRRSAMQYDRTGDDHYDLISALHKSIRGSDVDASVFWLVSMIERGEDPLFIARRMIVAASEDVNTPEALNIALNTYQACQLVGYPECAENLAQAVVFLAESEKSTRAYRALQKARTLVREGTNYPVPVHIRNAPTKLMRSLDYAKDYRYEPSFAHPVHQEYFPSQLKGTRLVSPPPGRAPDAPMSAKGEQSTMPKLADVSPATRWTGAHAVPANEGVAQSLRLAPSDAQGPGSCQRVWKIGARAVDLDLLDEWERERNGGVRWQGRDALEKSLGVERDDNEETTKQGPPQDSRAANDSADVATPRRTAGRFRPSAQQWDPSVMLQDPAASGVARPAYAIILLNAPIHADHRRTFERLWNGANYRVCADGGANRLHEAYRGGGESRETVLDPHAILGDLDSLHAHVRDYFSSLGVAVHHRPSQYATDLQKCIQHIEDVEALSRSNASVPGTTSEGEMQLVIFGGLSGRLDQTLHTIHTLWLLAPGVSNGRGVEDPDAAESDDPERRRGGRLKKRKRTFVVSENSVAWVLPQGEHELHLSPTILGKTCGMLPIGAGPVGVRIETEGLEWDLDGTQRSAIGGFLSTSNHVARARVKVQTDGEFCWTVELRKDSEGV
ncbi:hypothetical protein IE81DRAFT_327215 [Ceraceosorus guamensis]|uniref:Uncharacterized protein n=1 Tax=Ceraceosorus guamensis TaxID=1522189 RepID=A0A316VM55_9BASI|nr:hypothetical protein IE81DRAFT_327215 [Ceraceosorus guamensis]PWN38709.1 hypothetical protein IE81DRAFT_327215 [Ceraceosorus guamensis]